MSTKISTPILTECKEFLNKNKNETIIMSLKIDDWNGISNLDIKPLDSLKAFIEKQLGNGNLYYISEDLPQLKDIRGKIYFINRITEDLKFGVPIDWKFNSEGCYANFKTGQTLSPNARSFQVYVQDKSEITDWRGPIEDKFKIVTNAFAHKKTGEILLNFASAIDVKKCGIYVMALVLHYFGNLQNRKENFGWILFDYATEPYYVQMKNADDLRIANCVDIIIASNFKYAGYQTTPFEVKCELPPYAPRPRNFD